MLDLIYEFEPETGSSEGLIANVDHGVVAARSGVALLARMALVFESSEMPITQLHDMLHGSGMVYFELITGVVLGVYAMVTLVNDPELTDTETVLKVLQAHLSLILFILAVLCPVTTVPIAFALSANSLLSVARDYAKGHQKVVKLEAKLKQAQKSGQSPDAVKAIQQSLNKQIKCNDKLLQRMFLLVLGIVGIALMVCPGTQLIGAVVLLSNLVVGIATTVKPVPLHAIGAGVGCSVGLFDAEQQNAPDLEAEPINGSVVAVDRQAMAE